MMIEGSGSGSATLPGSLTFRIEGSCSDDIIRVESQHIHPVTVALTKKRHSKIKRQFKGSKAPKLKEKERFWWGGGGGCIKLDTP
jgi:hypothetical protein